jgi:outer membrane protein OmpU
MNNFKKVGLTALAGSLAAISANAAEMSVSGATVITYTSNNGTEVTGNPMGMKTNLGFTASGEVNGYTVSYMQTSKDQFAGMSSARLSMDMGDMGVLAFDQGSGSGLATIDDKTPTAAEEIWDGLNGLTVGGLVGAAGNSGVFNYVKTFNGVKLNAAVRKGAGAKNNDGAASGTGAPGGAWDFALTAGDDVTQIPGLSGGLGYGEADATTIVGGNQDSSDEHMTAFANFSYGPATIGYQLSNMNAGKQAGINEETEQWGIAFNVNDNLSVSYGEREVEYQKTSATHITESGEGIAIAYTMGSIKIAGNRNEVGDNNGTKGAVDESTEIAVSFAF